ncbi:RidA family protein [Variovorax sp. J22P271]|uniref:RidA family protein n=1 Tax=Variovorax davisae TaxID=3053515 RepID=UPI002574FA1C|nr:RidA family protein [Variovorax sp. J22P271]MDM0033432.1 RidA family protein [Variovorax sp. J22P271]
MSANSRLAELGITLPTPVAPAASYVAYLRSDDYLFIAGQVPITGGEVKYIGRLGESLSLEEGVAAARLCGINILSQVSAALGGDLDRVVSCIRLGGFVNATPAFTEHPKVINGASDLMLEVFGPVGKHARAAVGVASLPRGVGVEVDAIFRVR